LPNIITEFVEQARDRKQTLTSPFELIRQVYVFDLRIFALMNIYDNLFTTEDSFLSLFSIVFFTKLTSEFV